MRPRVRDLPISTSLRLRFLIHTEKLVIHFLLTSISILHLLKSAAVKPLRRGRTEKSTNHVGGPVAKKSIDVIIRRRWKKKYERLNYITTRLTALGPTLELSAYWVARRKWHHKMQKKVNFVCKLNVDEHQSRVVVWTPQKLLDFFYNT